MYRTKPPTILNAGTNTLSTNTTRNGAHFSRHVAHIRRQLKATNQVVLRPILQLGNDITDIPAKAKNNITAVLDVVIPTPLQILPLFKSASYTPEPRN